MSSARGGTVPDLLASALRPLGRVSKGVRLIVGGVDVIVAEVSTDGDRLIITCDRVTVGRHIK
jgi:hypothetical protein